MTYIRGPRIEVDESVDTSTYDALRAKDKQLEEDVCHKLILDNQTRYLDAEKGIWIFL